MNDSLHSLLNSGMASSTILMVSAADFKAFTDRLVEETRLAVEEQYRPVYLTREEVMALLKIKSTTLHNYVKQGKLRPVCVGSQPRFIRKDIDEAITQGRLGKYTHNK